MAMAGGTGCALTPPKDGSTAKFFLEASPGGPARSQEVSIGGTRPLTLLVERGPFLTEAEIAKAAVEHYVDGDVIAIEFTPHGQLWLDSVSTANIGRRIVVLGHFGVDRWIAAPRIADRVGNGILRFVPLDLTRAEAERFVRGLNETSAFLDRAKLR